MNRIAFKTNGRILFLTRKASTNKRIDDMPTGLREIDTVARSDRENCAQSRSLRSGYP